MYFSAFVIACIRILKSSVLPLGQKGLGDEPETISIQCFRFSHLSTRPHFSITQILREINFGGSTSAISDISTYLVIMNFVFYEIMYFLMAEISQINII